MVFSYHPMRTAFPMFLSLLNLITLTVKIYISILLSPSNLIINTFLKLYLYFIFGMSLEFHTQNIETKILVVHSP